MGIVPLYYALESISLYGFCSTDTAEACKFVLHHIYTISIFFMFIATHLLLGPTIIVSITHSLFNVLSHVNKVL